MPLSKTDFLQYLNCPKSLWLLKHRPDEYPHGEFTAYAQKLSAEGREVEAHVRALLTAQSDADAFSFQTEFRTDRELIAIADVIKNNGDGTINIYEVKSSTSVKREQIKDAAFQKIVAEEAGARVAQVFIVHLNSKYVRNGEIDQDAMLVFADVTSNVAAVVDQTRNEIDTALKLLDQGKIDETSCSCLLLTRSNHCDTFGHFNRHVLSPSIYSLPRISRTMIGTFVEEGRFDLTDIDVSEVSAGQGLVLRSAQAGEPIIDKSVLAEFYSKAEYPLYFLDYETYSSAVPIVDGARPQAPIPFQYSLHVKQSPDDTQLAHVEYLAEEAAMPLAMVEHMRNHIGTTGSIVSWHASFENTQNRTMVELYPEHAKFLESLINRALDLEGPFKEGYVDIAFGGSTSIKKVLPVLADDLSYEGMEVASGTDAMEAWIRFTALPEGPEKVALRDAMLEYCKLDTYAMVRIFEVMERIAS